MQKFSNKKKIILGSIIGVLIGTLVSVSYAFFTYANTGTNSSLVAGNIYMRYKETTTNINIDNMMPMSGDPLPSSFFEFTVEGTNTTTDKDIIYDINIIHGDPYDDGDQDPNNDKVRIRDEFLRFTLMEKIGDGEWTTPVNAKKYSDFSQGLRMWVNQINRNTTNKVTNTYRLYVWIDESVKIGNNDQDYTISEWNNLFASVKVNVTGDFSNKEIYRELTASDKVLQAMTNKETTNSCNAHVTENGTTYLSGIKDGVSFSEASLEASPELAGVCNIDFNYVWYSGKLWRVTAIYEDGSMKLVTENGITSIAFNGGSDPTFLDSYVYQWLNQDFLDTLDGYSNIIDTTKKWNVAQTSDVKTIGTSEVSSTVGLLNSYEYYKSYGNIDSKVGYLINGGCSWLINQADNNWQGRPTVWYVGNTGDASGITPNSTYAVRPSIITKSAIQFAGGTGTKNNPFILKGQKDTDATGDNINTRISGEYVTLGSDLYRIVEIENNTTKLVAMNSLGTKYYTTNTTNPTFTSGTSSTDYAYKYLTDVWYNNLSYKNKLTSGTYYTGTVAQTFNSYYVVDIDSYKLGICSTYSASVTTSSCTPKATSETLNVGLLRYGEMLASNAGSNFGTWLINQAGNNYQGNPSVWSVLYDGSTSSGPDYPRDVRPTIHLKSEITISGGTGLPNDPYTVS